MPVSICRESDVRDGGRPAAGGKQCDCNGNGFEDVATRAGRRQRAPPPAAAQPPGQSHSRLDAAHTTLYACTCTYIDIYLLSFGRF